MGKDIFQVEEIVQKSHSENGPSSENKMRVSVAGEQFFRGREKHAEPRLCRHWWNRSGILTFILRVN